MRDASDAANNSLGTKSVESTFYFKGGATTKFLAIGSNELAMCTVEQLQDSLNQYASYLIQQQFTCNVIIMGCWPGNLSRFPFVRGCSIS